MKQRETIADTFSLRLACISALDYEDFWMVRCTSKWIAFTYKI